MRGLGKKIGSCQDGEELSGRKCYDKCKDGFTGWGTTCYQDCITDSAKTNDMDPNSMAFCKRPKNEGRQSSTKPLPGYEKVGLKYFSPCKAGYKATATQCVGQCPEGTTDAGWWGCRKTTYQRQGHSAQCTAEQELSKTKLTCYEKCPNEAKGVGPFCFGKCPEKFGQCFGILCLAPGEKCTSIWTNLASRVQKIVDAGMN